MNSFDAPTWFETGTPPPNSQVRVVRIPRGLTNKRRLFAIFVRELDFPSYFGWNWDAFEECLCDLSWLHNQGVFIVHQDLPFRPASRDRANYMAVLDRARQSGERIRCWIAESDQHLTPSTPRNSE